MLRVLSALLATGAMVSATEGQAVACGTAKDCGKEEICLEGTCVPAVGRVYVLTIVEGEVSERKGTGQPWDAAGGLPDPRVDVKFPSMKSAVGSTKAAQDTLKPKWNASVELTVTAVGQELWLCVVDQDALGDDPITTGRGSCVGKKDVVKLVRQAKFTFRSNSELRLLRVSITPK